MDWRTLATIGLEVLAVWAILVGLLLAFRPRGVQRELLRVIPDVLRLVRRLVGRAGAGRRRGRRGARPPLCPAPRGHRGAAQPMGRHARGFALLSRIIGSG